MKNLMRKTIQFHNNNKRNVNETGIKEKNGRKTNRLSRILEYRNISKIDKIRGIKDFALYSLLICGALFVSLNS
jgi:hypothetical protein